MSPMYSLLVPLNGIFVDTMLTKMPRRLSRGILYRFHLIWFAVLVMTSLPPSKSRGIRFAKRNTLIWPVSIVVSRAPTHTAASTRKAWPSGVLASPW